MVTFEIPTHSPCSAVGKGLTAILAAAAAAESPVLEHLEQIKYYFLAKTA